MFMNALRLIPLSITVLLFTSIGFGQQGTKGSVADEILVKFKNTVT